MKRFLFISMISPFVLFISCKKNATLNNSYTAFNVEDFRKGNMDDYQTIMTAYDSIPNNSYLQFANKTYTLTHTLITENTYHFLGPATITRENQITYTLKEPADENSTYLVLNSTNEIISSDRIIVCLNDSTQGATAINVAVQVNGDTIILNSPIGKTFGNNSSFPAGTKLFKNINFFWIISPTEYPEMSCSFTNITFDGNRDNNKGSYTWNLNTAVLALTKGTTSYKNCTFVNSPNESIVGHNANIQNCTFNDLNGSGFHTSADKENCTEAEIHSYVSNNTFENTNQVSTTITGHSEGAITHSNSGGYYTAEGNTFINVGESVLGAMYPSSSSHDWGTSDITFTGNTINGAGRMVYLIDTSSGIIHDVRIDKNIISNMSVYDYSSELKYWPDITLKQVSRY